MSTKHKPKATKGYGKMSEWTDWLGSQDSTVLRDNTTRAIRGILESLDTPISLGVWLKYKYGLHAEAAKTPIDQMNYLDFEKEKFRADYMSVMLLSKARFLKMRGKAPNFQETDAIKKFILSERLCDETNKRFLSFKGIQSEPPFEGEIARIIHRAWYWIGKVVGEGPSLEDFFALADWGPGTTQDCTGKSSSGYEKFQSERTATTRLWHFIGSKWKHQNPGWSMDTCKYSDAIEILTVPKNAFIDRVIGREPGVNTRHQKAMGLWLRGRLRAIAGIDLETGQEKHGMLSLIASIFGDDATVDFSMASDLNAKEAVRFLLSTTRGGRGLLYALELCRTPLYLLNNEQRPLEKFSGMGCGYTFELETLIFWALAMGTAEIAGRSTKNVSVFGDDVILPSDCCELFLRTCRFMGMKPNDDKSFSTGGFRESCGSHYFYGEDCKPIYLEEPITNGKETFILANKIRLAANRFGGLRFCDSRFRRCWDEIVSLVPKSLRTMAPAASAVSKLGYGTIGYVPMTDGALIVNFDEATPQLADTWSYPEICYKPVGTKLVWGGTGWISESVYKKTTVQLTPQGWEGYIVKHFADVPIKFHGYGAGMLLLRLNNRSTEMPHYNAYEVRDVTRTSYKSFVVASWTDLGPWLGSK